MRLLWYLHKFNRTTVIDPPNSVMNELAWNTRLNGPIKGHAELCFMCILVESYEYSCSQITDF